MYWCFSCCFTSTGYILIFLVVLGVLVYDKSTWFDSQPHIIPDNGDGTVNIRSLRGCLSWQNQQKQPVFHKEFPQVEHMAILQDANIIQYLKQVLVGS
jgi:lysophospholipase-3